MLAQRSDNWRNNDEAFVSTPFTSEIDMDDTDNQSDNQHFLL